MDSLPLISIIIPVFNGSDYLAEAIDSALEQTYPNIEILVINDGSNDFGKTKKIASSYENKIRYFEKENGGVSTALNFGIKNMCGEYFSWLSHDDKYLPDKIEKQINFILEHKAKNVILYSDIAFIDDNSKIISYNIYPHHSPANFRPAFIKDGLINGCTLLIPKICFVECGIFDISLRTTQDYELWFRFSQKFDFIHLSDVTVYSRLHENQDTIKLKNIVLKERDDLHKYFISNIAIEEIKRFSNGNISGYYIEYSKKMNALCCPESRKYSINKALVNLRKSNFLELIPNIFNLTILSLKINGRSLYNYFMN